MTEIKNGNGSRSAMENNYGELSGIMEDSSSHDTPRIFSEFQDMYIEYVASSRAIPETRLKQLAAISCTIYGAKLILEVEINFLRHLCTEFILNKARDNSQSQKYALLTLGNCLAIVDLSYKSENLAKYGAFNAMTTEEGLLLKLFSLSLFSNYAQAKENALSSIYSIIYNNDERFAQEMVLNPTYNIMGLLFNHMHTSPRKEQIIEIFRIFYIIIKKLKFANLDQFGKMRKFIINALKNSNCQ
jgi:hypothetical protein